MTKGDLTLLRTGQVIKILSDTGYKYLGPITSQGVEGLWLENIYEKEHYRVLIIYKNVGFVEVL